MSTGFILCSDRRDRARTTTMTSQKLSPVRATWSPTAPVPVWRATPQPSRPRCFALESHRVAHQAASFSTRSRDPAARSERQCSLVVEPLVMSFRSDTRSSPQARFCSTRPRTPILGPNRPARPRSSPVTPEDSPETLHMLAVLRRAPVEDIEASSDLTRILANLDPSDRVAISTALTRLVRRASHD